MNVSRNPRLFPSDGNTWHRVFSHCLDALLAPRGALPGARPEGFQHVFNLDSISNQLRRPPGRASRNAPGQILKKDLSLFHCMEMALRSQRRSPGQRRRACETDSTLIHFQINFEIHAAEPRGAPLRAQGHTQTTNNITRSLPPFVWRWFGVHRGPVGGPSTLIQQ